MPQLGRFEKYFVDASGNALASLSVEIRKQGALANGSSGGGNSVSFTCHDPGAIVVGNSVQINEVTTVTRQADAVTATVVTLSGVGHTWVDGDRLSVSSSLPTLYTDAQGIDTIANPLTTDSRGRATCYLRGGFYDVRVSGTGFTTTLLRDVFIPSMEMKSSQFDAATAVAWAFDTDRDLAASGAKLLSLREVTIEKFSVDKDGGFVAGAASSLTGGLTLTTGALTFSTAASQIVPGATSLALRNNANSANNILISDAGRVTVREDLVFATALSQIVPGATSLSLRNNADSADNLLISDAGVATVRAGLNLTAGDLDVQTATAFVRGARIRMDRGTAHVAGDYLLTGWGTGATLGIVTSNTDTRGQISVTTGTSPSANPTVRLTYKDGAFPVGQFFAAINSGSATPFVPWAVQAAGATSVTFIFLGTPVASSTYGLYYFVLI